MTSAQVTQAAELIAERAMLTALPASPKAIVLQLDGKVHQITVAALTAGVQARLATIAAALTALGVSG